MTIRKATIEDVPQIVSLIKTIHVKNLDDLSGGFLTSPDVTVDHYRDLVARKKFCYVAVDGGAIVGLIMADPFGRHWKRNYGYYSKLLGGKDFTFIERIGILPGYRHRGLGRELYGRVFDDSRGKLFVANISKDPRNRASEEFHQKLGFEKIDEHVWDDGTEGFIYALDKKS